jgi:GrpB-like predicted nucleotidyltransferase (UPF0157 family)
MNGWKGKESMNNKNSEDLIEIVPYDPNWFKMAEEEINKIRVALSPQSWVIDIQHIGSTSIPGLAAKPIIDIYIGARSIEEARESIRSIEALGYQYWYDNLNKEKMFFVKGMPPFGSGRTHHIHIVEYNSSYWRARILFRDYMRQHPEAIKEYAHLKINLMQENNSDREAYTDAKYDFIANILKKAGFNEEVKR